MGPCELLKGGQGGQLIGAGGHVVDNHKMNTRHIAGVCEGQMAVQRLDIKFTDFSQLKQDITNVARPPGQPRPVVVVIVPMAAQCNRTRASAHRNRRTVC